MDFRACRSFLQRYKTLKSDKKLQGRTGNREASVRAAKFDKLKWSKIFRIGEGGRREKEGKNVPDRCAGFEEQKGKEHKVVIRR